MKTPKGRIVNDLITVPEDAAQNVLKALILVQLDTPPTGSSRAVKAWRNLFSVGVDNTSQLKL